MCKYFSTICKYIFMKKPCGLGGRWTLPGYKNRYWRHEYRKNVNIDQTDDAMRKAIVKFWNSKYYIFLDILEVMAKNRKNILCIFWGWPMDSRKCLAAKHEFFSLFSWRNLLRHNRGPGHKPKIRIMHFGWLANGPGRKCLAVNKSWIFHNFLEMVFFDIIEVLAKNRKYVIIMHFWWLANGRGENALCSKNIEFFRIFLKWSFST